MNTAEEEIVSARSISTPSLPVECNSHQDSSRQDSLAAAKGILKTVYMIPAFRYNVGSWFNRVNRLKQQKPKKKSFRVIETMH